MHRSAVNDAIDDPAVGVAHGFVPKVITRARKRDAGEHRRAIGRSGVISGLEIKIRCLFNADVRQTLRP
jgi:hypothetical protein